MQVVLRGISLYQDRTADERLFIEVVLLFSRVHESEIKNTNKEIALVFLLTQIIFPLFSVFVCGQADKTGKGSSGKDLPIDCL